MIRKIASMLPLAKNFKPLNYFGTHAPAPAKLQRVQQTTVKFNVKNSEGQWQQIHGIVGQPFLNSILRMKVHGAFSERLCYGDDLTYQPHLRPHDPFSSGPTCGMCRIVLKDNWYDRIMEQTDGMTVEEEFMLLQFTDARKDIRLACCLPVEKWMDGCTFEIYPIPQLSQIQEFH